MGHGNGVIEMGQ